MPVYCVYKIISLCPLCAFLSIEKEIVLAEASICLCVALDPPTKSGTGHAWSMVPSLSDGTNYAGNVRTGTETPDQL